jgi:hypothetical protein
MFAPSPTQPTLRLRRLLKAPETDVSHRSTSGKTALDFAVDMGHTECERALRDHVVNQVLQVQHMLLREDDDDDDDDDDDHDDYEQGKV